MSTEIKNTTSSKRLVVLVTGCTNNGIGSYLAKHFSLSNCIVYASARKLENLSDLDGLGCHCLELDVTSAESVRKVVEKIYCNEGRIDILVNNAGIGLYGPVAELDIEKVTQLIDTNVLGALRTTQAVAPIMIQQNSGTIVNVGSIVGDLCVPWGGLYSASKAALHSMTEALRLELRPFNIDVVAVKPGAVRSNISKNVLKKQARGSEHGQTILSNKSFYKEVEGFVLMRMNISQEDGACDTDTFGEKVVSWVLKRRNMTQVKLGYWLNPANVALGTLAWGIGYISPQLAPSMSYFSGYQWTLPNELVFGGKTWGHSLAKVIPKFVVDAVLWSKFGLGTLAASVNSHESNKKED